MAACWGWRWRGWRCSHTARRSHSPARTRKVKHAPVQRVRVSKHLSEVHIRTRMRSYLDWSKVRPNRVFVFAAETVVNVLDFKKDVGLWHAVLTVRPALVIVINLKMKRSVSTSPRSIPQSVMNMMHVVSIPYALMKVNPLSWIQKVCQFKGN